MAFPPRRHQTLFRSTAFAMLCGGCVGMGPGMRTATPSNTVTKLSAAPVASFEPIVVVREREIYVGHRSDCARQPGEAQLVEPCRAVQDRWFAIERVRCDGRCDADEVAAMGIGGVLETSRQGFATSAPLKVVRSGVVDAAVVDAVRSAVATGSDGAALYPEPELGGDTDVWWAHRD